jgi:hypothetical protein
MLTIARAERTCVLRFPVLNQLRRKDGMQTRMATFSQQAQSKEDEKNRPAAGPDSLLFDMDLPLRETFYPLGFAVEILTNDQDVLAAAEDSFGHVAACRTNTNLQIRIGITDGIDSGTPPTPTRREYNHLYSLIADASNQSLLDLNTHTNFAWLTRSALNNRLYFRYNFLEKIVYLLLGSSLVTDIHAACVGKNGKGILLCGNSGAGKSTLAYACARVGWTYTSDDTSYLVNSSDVPFVIGHAHRVRFRPAARDLFPELRDFEITPRMEGKPSIELPVSRLPIFNTATDATIHAVVYLNRFPAAMERLDRLSDGTATRSMCAELYSAGEIRAKHERLLEVFFNTPTYELQYCSLDQGIAQLEELVQAI